jgi:hypothetical protein
MKHPRVLVAVIALAVAGTAAMPVAATERVDVQSTAKAEIVGSSRISNVGTQYVTVRGTGFTGLAVGNRPPLAGRATGVYVVFGRFDEAWKPSAGAPASSRRTVVESQIWALPAASKPFVDPTGTNPNVVTMAEDGSFTARVPVSAIDGTGTYAIAVYPGSGAINAAHEFLLPLTFASPFNPLLGGKLPIAQLARDAGLEVAANSKVSAAVRADSARNCRVVGKRIEMLRVGRCLTSVSVETGDTTIIKRITLRISKQ